MNTELTFTKLHGCANDYLFVDCTERELTRASQVARLVSDRHQGVGADGLILVCRSDSADFRMEMYNADGSRAQMCGNGIRGLGKYVGDRWLAGSDAVSVETDAGVKTLDLIRNGEGRVERVVVDMGAPVLEGRLIPVAAEGRVIDHPLEVAGKTWTVSCVSMGNPHCVTFDADPAGLDLAKIGPCFEELAFFPEGINTEFVRVDSPTHLTLRVWERGSGETMACGTGACAVVVAAALSGRAERRVTVSLRGGDLDIEFDDETVRMTGPAVEVFSATVLVELDDNSIESGDNDV